jgi:Zn-dependent peptidase ImmA (M78 family)
MNLSPEKQAAKIIEQYWPSEEFPVDPVTIAEQLNINVMDTELPDNVSGALFKEPGKDPMITLHYSDSDARKRFTCAHELGRYIARLEDCSSQDSFEFVDYRHRDSSNGENTLEVFANQFAADLLMPRPEVTKMVEKGSDLIELAQFFGVSHGAMTVRLQSLKLEAAQ